MNRSTILATSAVSRAGTVDTDLHPTASNPRGAVDNYRFEHFDFRLLQKDMRFSQGSLRADVDYRSRAEPDDVVYALRTFSEKCDSNESLC